MSIDSLSPRLGLENSKCSMVYDELMCHSTLHPDPAMPVRATLFSSQSAQRGLSWMHGVRVSGFKKSVENAQRLMLYQQCLHIGCICISNQFHLFPLTSAIQSWTCQALGSDFFHFQNGPVLNEVLIPKHIWYRLHLNTHICFFSSFRSYQRWYATLE